MNTDLLFIEFYNLQSCEALTKNDTVDSAYFNISEVLSDLMNKTIEQKIIFFRECLDAYVIKLRKHNYWEKNIIFRQNSPYGIIEKLLNVIITIDSEEYLDIIIEDIDKYTGNDTGRCNRRIEFDMIKILATIPQASVEICEKIIKEPFFTVLTKTKKYAELMKYCLRYENLEMLEYILNHAENRYMILAITDNIEICIRENRMSPKMACVILNTHQGHILKTFIEELFVQFSTFEIDDCAFAELVKYHNVPRNTLKKCARCCLDRKHYEMCEWLNKTYLNNTTCDKSYILNNVTMNEFGYTKLVNIKLAEEAMKEWDEDTKVKVLLSMCLKSDVESIEWLVSKYKINVEHFYGLCDYIRHNKDYSYDALIWILRNNSFGLKEMIKSNVISKKCMYNAKKIIQTTDIDIITNEVMKYGSCDDLEYVCDVLELTKVDLVVMRTIIDALCLGKVNKAQLLVHKYGITDKDFEPSILKNVFDINIYKGRIGVIQWMLSMFKTLKEVNYCDEEKLDFVKHLSKKGYLLMLQWYIQKYGINEDIFDRCMLKASKHGQIYVHQYLLRYAQKSLEDNYMLVLTSYGSAQTYAKYIETFYKKKLIRNVFALRSILGLDEEELQEN